jgi:ribosomal protein S4
MKRNKPKKLLLGEVKSHLTRLTKSKLLGFKARKITFSGLKEDPWLIKSSREKAFLNSWQKNYLAKKETSALYSLDKKSRAKHQLNLLEKGGRSLFSKVESRLDVLVVRVGWALNLNKAHGLIKEGVIKVNQVTTRNPLKVLKVGSDLERQGVFKGHLPDLTFLPHLMEVGPKKLLLFKEPEFCPELVFYNLKQGLRNLC